MKDTKPCKRCGSVLRSERDYYKAIVDKLEKTADAVHIVPGMELWLVGGLGVIPTRAEENQYNGRPYYSTAEAAEAAYKTSQRSQT